MNEDGKGSTEMVIYMLSCRVPSTLSIRLRRRASKTRVTANTTVGTAWAVVLERLCRIARAKVIVGESDTPTVGISKRTWRARIDHIVTFDATTLSAVKLVPP